MKRLKKLLLMLLGALLAAAGLFAIVRSGASDRALQVTSAPRKYTSTTSVSLVAYNIAHGRGDGDDNFDGGDRDQRAARLRGIADHLRALDADIVVLNEVDFESVWSYGVNQAEVLARLLGMEHRAEQANLDFGWPKIRFRFGNAILSRYPLEDCRLVDYVPHSELEAVVVGHKRGVICTVSLEPKFRVVAVHLEHRSEEVRLLQVGQLLEATTGAPPVVLAGDFNSTRTGFPGARKTRSGVTAFDLMVTSERFQARPRVAPRPEDLTFSSRAPRYVIDWVVIPADWGFADYRVPKSPLSDHQAVFTRLTF